MSSINSYGLTTLATAPGDVSVLRIINYSCTFNEEFKYILLPVSYGTFFVLGLVLNTVALWMFVCKMRPWNATTTYMFNLAMSDLLYVLSLPLLTFYYANRSHWPFGVMLCKLTRFLFYSNLYCSILFLMCISVHRYLGICYPIRSLSWLKVRNARLVCLLVWAAVITCLVPNLIFVTTSRRGEDILCHDTTRPEFFPNYVAYSSSLMALLFVAPFLVILFCYTFMAWELSKVHMPSSEVKRKSIKMIIIVLVVFVVCFVPFHITRSIYYSFRLQDKSCHALNIVNFTYKITRPLASANSCVDPILYFLAGDNYRGRLRYAMTRRTCIRRQDTRHGSGLSVIITSESTLPSNPQPER